MKSIIIKILTVFFFGLVSFSGSLNANAAVLEISTIDQLKAAMSSGGEAKLVSDIAFDGHIAVNN